MRRSVTIEDLSKCKVVGMRVMYRYSNKSVIGTCLAIFEDALWVEFEDGSDVERHYKSWEIIE